jgi:hypothetical protein
MMTFWNGVSSDMFRMAIGFSIAGLVWELSGSRTAMMVICGITVGYGIGRVELDWFIDRRVLPRLCDGCRKSIG